MEEQVPQGDKPSLLKLMLNQPVAALASLRKIDEITGNIARIRNEITASASMVDSLFNTIAVELSEFADGDSGKKSFQDTQAKLLEFSKAILDQYKKKRSEEIGAKLAEEEKALQQERESVIAAMESFLASDPDLFSPVRTVIKWVDGHYDGKSLYRARIDRASCDNSPRGLWKFLGSEEVSVSYEFSLKSSSVALFAGALRVGDLRKGFRLPIGSAVGWASKEAVVNFEKMDRYYLSSAEINGNNTSMTFSMDDTDSRFIFSLSDYSDNSVLGISYVTGNQSTDLVSNTALGNNIDMESAKAVSKTIFDALKALSGFKGKLSVLTVQEKDVLATLDAVSFMKACVALYQCIHLKGEKQKNAVIPRDLSKDYIKERMQILGKDASIYSQFLGIP